MGANLKKPPDSPTGDVEEWRTQWKEWVAQSWAPYQNEPAGLDKVVQEDLAEPTQDAGREREDENSISETEKGNGVEESEEQTADEAEIEGKLRPLVPEGELVMVCIDYKVVTTRFGKKDYLYWREEKNSPILEQFFRHYEKYPVNSKAVENYLVAMGERPKRLDRMTFHRFIGLKADVYVETVKPTYSSGALKGRAKAEVLHYSKVSEILRPLGHVNTDTLRELREGVL